MLCPLIAEDLALDLERRIVSSLASVAEVK